MKPYRTAAQIRPAPYPPSKYHYGDILYTTKKELIERAQKSNMDYHAGNIKTQEELELESNNW